MPLTELWTDEGPVAAKRGRQLSEDNIKAILNNVILNNVIFVVADLGEKLNWIEGNKIFDLWKNDLQKHFWNPDDEGVYLDMFPDGYVYFVTEWIDEANRTIVLLEKHQ